RHHCASEARPTRTPETSTYTGVVWAKTPASSVLGWPAPRATAAIHVGPASNPASNSSVDEPSHSASTPSGPTSDRRSTPRPTTDARHSNRSSGDRSSTDPGPAPLTSNVSHG